MKALFLTIFTLTTLIVGAQTQTLKGKIVDKETLFPLIGATVTISTTNDSIIGSAATDLDGYYNIPNVHFGKYKVQVSFLGYKNIDVPNVMVDAGKERILDVELEESSVTLNEVKITLSRKDATNNEMATVSARTFNVEETNRYAGSRADPARMASNYAGAQGADDTRNDIVVRGNTPTAVLWRIEDMDIPNPSHFAIAGTNGGPVSMLNNKMLRKSDFFTGAFPAEYGNATGGVFDLKFRNGNNEKHEFTGQFGFLGTEMTAEGPLGDSTRASYLVNARYSTLALFNFMGINIGTDATPQYMDGAFKLNFPLKNNANLSFFGMGGKSNIDIMVSDQTELSDEIYGQRDRDQLFGTSMGVTGVNYFKSINKKLLFKMSVAASGSQSGSRHVKVERDLDFAITDTFTIRRYDVIEQRVSSNASLTYKWSSKNTLKSGVNYTQYFYNMFDFNFDSAGTAEKLIDFNTQAGLMRLYSQWKHKASEKLTLNLGVNGQMFMLNNSTAVEPRAGLSYQFNKKNSLSLGYGIHSMVQPSYFYFQEFENTDGDLGTHNKDLGFTRSNHYVMAYDLAVSKKSRIKVEVYYQNLYNIPVYKDTATAFSMINFGSTYRFIYPPELENSGTGRNYGFEFTYERFFSKSFFLLTTVSLYESNYKGSDGIERNTAYNGNYTGNILAGKEWTFGKDDNKTLGLGGKITYAGGKRYTPIDTAASFLAEDAIEEMALTNSEQFEDYFRADVKISYKVNMKSVTHEFAIDLINATGQKNVLKKTYVPALAGAPPLFIDEYQLGFFPVFYYKIDF
jgi:hypothetical protein